MMNLTCFFKNSGLSHRFVFFFHLINSTYLYIIVFGEQGRCNDLLSKCDGPVPQDDGHSHLVSCTKLAKVTKSRTGVGAAKGKKALDYGSEHFSS
jgi:hypothetical protein